MNLTGSLRLRLLLASALTIALALGIAAVVMGWMFAHHLERSLARELIRDGQQLIANVHLADDGRIVLDAPLSDPRFELPGSGRYWQVSGADDQERSLSLWDETLPALTTVVASGWHTHSVAGPFSQHLLIVERLITPHPDVAPLRVQLAQDLAELNAARAEFRGQLALFLGILWLVLVLAAWVQVDLGLQPLKRVRREVDAMRKRPAARLGDGHPREIQPLVKAINELASAREHDLTRARKRAADLAHSLKTPLAALNAQTRRARETGADDAADGLERAIAAVSATVEAELARARAASIRSQQHTPRSHPAEIAERVIAVIERTERGGDVVFENSIDPTLELPLASDDLMELLGALSENAARFARRRVRIGGHQDADARVLSIEDDGAGLDISAEQALMRGGRLDEAGHGHHGLGLAMARDLVDATQGQIALERSELGGLLVRMCWVEQN